MLINGNFEIETFVFQMFPQMDAIHDGLMDLIPHWQVVYGGVQILDTSEYIPDPYWAGNFAIHLNYMYGPGVIISSPLVTPRKGATYNLTFDIADNPDGGPLYKALRVKILVNNQEAEPIIDPYNVSAPGQFISLDQTLPMISKLGMNAEWLLSKFWCPSSVLCDSPLLNFFTRF